MARSPAAPSALSSALDVPSVEKELRTTVRELMDSPEATPKDYARLDEILNRKVALMRAPLDAKLRRIYKRAS